MGLPFARRTTRIHTATIFAATATIFAATATVFTMPTRRSTNPNLDIRVDATCRQRAGQNQNDEAPIAHAQNSPLIPAELGAIHSPTFAALFAFGAVSNNVTPAVAARPPTTNPTVESVRVV
jgi:hypothetical protein